MSKKNTKDAVAQAMRDVSREHLERSAKRDARIEIRVTEDVKQDIVNTAADLGLSVTEYLESLHGYAGPRLRK